MRKGILFPLIVLSVFSAGALNVTFSGATHPVLSVEPDKNTGLETVYVAWKSGELDSMTISDISSDAAISRYSNLGGGFAEPQPFVWEGNGAVVSHPAGDMGYIVTTGGKSYAFWLTDYSKHQLKLVSISPASEQYCDNTSLNVQGEGGPINYFSIDGRSVELRRDLHLEYINQEWSEEDMEYIHKGETKVLNHLMDPIVVVPPFYCHTDVTLEGDRFLREWKIPQSVSCSNIGPNGVACHTGAEQTNAGADDPSLGSNLIKNNTEGLGGSAPAVILFKAYPTEAVIHDEWQISRYPEFDNLDYRFNQRDVEYSFEEEGTYYVRYVGSDATGTCETFGDVYTVSIGASELRIPNAFSPNDDGVNDIWRIGYRSLLHFNCWIFDRYGNEIYHFSDPAGGWDGKYNGKKVESGVYFYVIEATGSDGKKYKRGGDINVVGYKTHSTINSGQK